jgi:hypothetical protein
MPGFCDEDVGMDPYRGAPSNDTMRGHTKRLAMSYSRTNVRTFILCKKVLLDAPSINAFKNGLDKSWENDDSKFE